jgi:hypothetical protein
MEGISSGKSVLRDAERALLDLVAKAAASGDYPSISTLSTWAQKVAELRDGSAHDLGLDLNEELRPKKERRTPSKKRRSSKQRTATYPKFARDEDHLVKIGWSKKERREYEHKTHQNSVRSLVSSIIRAGRNGTRFSMESVLPITSLSGEPVPDYQSYLILAWLRSVGLVEQHGRLGYTIDESVDLVQSVEDLWSQLPVRSFSSSQS